MKTTTPLMQLKQHLTIFFDVFNLPQDAWPKVRLAQLEDTVRTYEQTPHWQFVKRASLKRTLLAQKNSLFESLWLFQKAKTESMQMKAMVQTVIPKIDAAYLNYVIHLEGAARLLQERRILKGLENYLNPQINQLATANQMSNQNSKTASIYLGQLSQQKNQNTSKKPNWNLEQALNAFLFIHHHGRERYQQRLNTLCQNVALHPIWRQAQPVVLNEQTLILPDRTLERFTLKKTSRFLKGGWLIFTWPWVLAKKVQEGEYKKYQFTQSTYAQFSTQLFLKLVGHTHDLNAFDTQVKTMCQDDVTQRVSLIPLDFNVYQSLQDLKALKNQFDSIFTGLKIIPGNSHQQTALKTKRKSVLSRFFVMFKKESEMQRFEKESKIMVRTETLETARYLLKTYEQAVKFKLREFGIWLKTDSNADMLTLADMQTIFKDYMDLLKTCEPVHTTFDDILHAHNLQLPIHLQHRFSLEIQDFKEAKIRLTLKLEGLLYNWKNRKLAAQQLAKTQTTQQEAMKKKEVKELVKPVKEASKTKAQAQTTTQVQTSLVTVKKKPETKPSSENKTLNLTKVSKGPESIQRLSYVHKKLTLEERCLQQLAQGKPVIPENFSQCYTQLQIEMNGLGASACMAFFSKIGASSPLHTASKKNASLAAFYPVLLKNVQDTLKAMIEGKDKNTQTKLTLESAHIYVSQIIHYFRVRCDFQRLKTIKTFVEQGLTDLTSKPNHDPRSTLNLTFENLKRLIGYLPEDMQARVTQDKAVLQEQLASASQHYYQEAKALIKAHPVLKHFDVLKALDSVCETCIHKARLDNKCLTKIEPELWKPLETYSLINPLSKSKDAAWFYQQLEVLILPYVQLRAAHDCLEAISKSVSQYVQQAQSGTLYHSDLKHLLDHLYEQQPLLKDSLSKPLTPTKETRLLKPKGI